MDWLATMALALGLSMDAFAASAAIGACNRVNAMRTALKAATLFAAFQMAMPLAGWLAGSAARDYAAGLDHWVAFALLAGVGGQMVMKSFKPTAKKQGAAVVETRQLLAVAVATSIDAFAAGVGFAFAGMPPLTTIIAIGTVTFALSLAGSGCGRKLAGWGARLEALGGVVLIALGTGILLSHLAA
ncbi:MAG: manganese efflux pump MntP family protein [Candidatus Micrarchaeota archaeon]